MHSLPSSRCRRRPFPSSSMATPRQRSFLGLRRLARSPRLCKGARKPSGCCSHRWPEARSPRGFRSSSLARPMNPGGPGATRPISWDGPQHQEVIMGNRAVITTREKDRALPALERRTRQRSRIKLLRAQGLSAAEHKMLRLGQALPGHRELLRRHYKRAGPAIQSP